LIQSMPETLDSTNDPALRSWVDAANDPASDFPIQNLPFGVFRRRAARAAAPPRVGVAIGDQIVDVVGCLEAGLLAPEEATAAAYCRSGRLNELMACGRERVSVLRRALSEALRTDSSALRGDRSIARSILVPMVESEMLLPVAVGDYTDFYASIAHAANVGSMFRPDNPLLPNYKWVPIGYHGRASSIVVSGTPIRRPSGQTRDAGDESPRVGPSRRLDYELEVGVFVGTGNALGEPVPIAEAERHVFGLCLVNDWSARDIQTWEYQPLGPFLAKSFITSVSPWLVTFDALEPYRVPAYTRPSGDPAPLPYLASADDARSGGIDITLEVLLSSEKMHATGAPPMLVSRGNFREMYWTIAQLIAHHTSNGCNLRPGDLLASGTVSGPTKDSRGCLLERTWRGTEPLTLPTGESRTFLENGDEVVLRGYCERAGRPRIGFGECRGRVERGEGSGE
jgi:fumarylacetoacetase